jgi:membrane protease YdiL (CAAX protease family)
MVRSIAWGFLAGAITLGILAIGEYALGVIEWDHKSGSELLYALFMGVISGLVIAAIEEPVFRGFLHSQFARRWGGAVATVGSSLIYAGVHFIRSRSEPESVSWHSGFDVLFSAFSAFARPETIGPFLTLFVAGAWLCLVRQKSGHLGWGIGLHAGWVAVIKLTRKATDLTHDPGLRWLADGYDQITGWLATLWLALLMFGWWVWTHRKCKD